jgi:hypothetical protein
VPGLLTDTGHKTSTRPVMGDNLNQVVILHGQTVSDEYPAEFSRLRSGTFGDLHDGMSRNRRLSATSHWHCRCCSVKRLVAMRTSGGEQVVELGILQPG